LPGYGAVSFPIWMPEMTLESACPCGTEATYDACCAPIHRDIQQAATALQLMRARYSAFVKCDIDFLHDSLARELRGDFDRVTASAWAKSEWLGLEVLGHEAGAGTDSEGQVEFVARFRLRGVLQKHHERARFLREDGAWRYNDGELVGETQAPVVAGPRIGRNEPCPCGSGKKYKKCCGGRQEAAA
jgi:SEC-C motif domain protein